MILQSVEDRVVVRRVGDEERVAAYLFIKEELDPAVELADPSGAESAYSYHHPVAEFLDVAAFHLLRYSLLHEVETLLFSA